MNELLNTAGLTMTSQEIADLVDSRHDSVKRAIERLAEPKETSRAPVIQLPPLVEVRNRLGQMVGNYVFTGEQGKRDSIVVVAQLSPEFTARLVDRWQELEGQQKPMTRLEFAKLQVKLIEDLERKEAEAEALRITLDESVKWASVKRMETRDKRPYDWRPLRTMSIEMGVEVQKVFDQNYGTVNSYRNDVWFAVYGVMV